MNKMFGFIGKAQESMPSIWDIIDINPVVVIVILTLIVATLVGVGYVIGKNSK